MDADRRINDLAAQQHAAFTRRQALHAGMSDTTLSRRVREGRYSRRLRGTFAIPGAPLTWHHKLCVACLSAGPGSAVSHRSAAQICGLCDDGSDPVEISVPFVRAPRLRGVLVHRSTDLDPALVVRRHGLPVTNPLRTMVDLGAVLGVEQLEDALDRGLNKHLFSVAAVEHMLDQLARSGRSGTGVLRRVLDDRALGDKRPDSLLEPRMARLIRDAELPPAVYQHVVKDKAGRFVARVDFAYPDRRIFLEVDAFEKHSTPRQMRDGYDRQNRLVAAGWTPVEFTWFDVVRRPQRVATRLREILCT